MKVAIIGSHGVGKTWLVNNIKESLPADKKVNLIQEPAAMWIKELGYDWRMSPPQLYDEFEKALFHYYLFAFMLPTSFISDRSPLDVLAYASFKSTDKTYMYLWEEVNNYRNFLFNDIKYYFYKTSDGENKEVIYIQNRISHIFSMLISEDKLTDYVTTFTREDVEEIRKEIVSLLSN